VVRFNANTGRKRVLPSFEEIPLPVLAQSRMMVYPHNHRDRTFSFFKSAVAFCQQHNLVLVHDFPYMLTVFDDAAAPRFCKPTQKTCLGWFFTLSKSYNMGGFHWLRLNAQLIRALREAAVDFNQYRGILNGAIVA